MRYRKLDADGDYTFGSGRQQFHENTPDAVAQAVKTRLALWTAEWFLDLTEGTPYSTQILGTGTRPIYDQAIKDRILGTKGVVSIMDYASVLDGRKLTVSAKIQTIYGEATI